MREKIFPANKNFWLWASLTGLLFAAVALAPQFDLLNERGTNWNGVYAVSEFDELAYMAYVQNVIDGKPRRSSPFSGRIDDARTPQKESLFSIQFFSTYPLALTARVLGLSGSQAMILLSAAVGFLSAFAVFSLFYALFQNAPLSFVGTTTVLFSGALVAGQGSVIAFISPETLKYYFSMMFLRRTNPATSFPALFLFFLFAFQFLIARPGKLKIGFGAAAFGCFTFTVYSYFYHWTTALAWFFALTVVWMIFNFERFKKEIFYLAGFGLSLVLVLVPWALMLSNRAASMDSAQLLVYTRQPDLWRIPTILSYLTIAGLFFLNRKDWLSVREPKFILLLSLALVSPVVFNQQIITNHSLQPFHYQYFCANYIAAFALLAVIFEVGRKLIQLDHFNKTLVLLVGAMLLLGYFDVLSSIYLFRKHNAWRDELYPAAQRIKSENPGNFSQENPPSVIMPFDFSHGDYLNGEDLPGLASQPTMWSPHLSMFPDIDWTENVDRFNKFLYFQNFTPERVSKEFADKNGWLLFGYFGPGRVSSLLTTEYNPVTKAETDEIVEQYAEFCRRFNHLEAQKPAISFVLVHAEFPNDLTNIDRWYERGEGEQIGKYILYRVRLRPAP
jgi:hypothetical protein